MSTVSRKPMSDQSWNLTRELRIPSEASAGKQFIEELLAQLHDDQWIEHDIFGVHLAVEEAIVNAIKHGNRNDASKEVHVVIKTSPRSIRIEITDQGSGFNLADVPDPTDDENLEAPSGRGIMLMRSFMSFVEYNEKGNRVVMEKHQADQS